jgi:Ca2+-binding RTX toxin-like protein
VPLPEALRKPTLVGVDSVGDQYLLVTAADGSLLRYALAADSWTDLGDLRSPTGATLYPVGDIAVVSPQQAWLIASDTPVDPVEPDQAKQQFLVRLDPLTASVQSVRPIGNLERTAPLLIGLDVDEGGALTALNQLGDFVSIDAASATVTGTRAVVGLPRNAGSAGGLSVLDGEDRTETRPGDDGVTITVGQDGKVEVGFGDQPTRHEWLDGDDTIDGGCGTDADQLHGDDYLGSDPALQLPSNLILIGGNDEIRGRDGNDTLDGGLQGDVLRGEAGNDRLLGGDTEPNRIEGGDGDDSIDGGAAGDHILGGAGNDSVAAGGGNDWVFGEAGRDSISGGDGHDVLVGGADEDTVRGDAGDDTLVVVNGDLGSAYTAVPTGTGGGSYDGGVGNDQLVAVRSHESAVADITLTAGSVQLGSAPVETVLGVESALLAGGSAGDTISAATFGGTTVIYGHGGNDTLTGSDQADQIFGGAGNDLVKAQGGNDTVRGGTGSNPLRGGTGDDLYLLDAASGDRVTEAAGEGNDTVDASASGADNSVSAGSTEVTAYAGTGFGFVLQGAVERLVLGAGDDLVRLEPGLASGLAVDAGAGQDGLVYDGWSSGVTVNLGAGSATGLAGAVNFEDVRGGDGNDSLVGSNADNHLEGGVGDDTVSGLGGNDLIYGQEGNDSLLGGSGDDLLDAGGGLNTMKGGMDNDTYAFLANAQTDQASEFAGEGSDHLNFGYVTSGALLFALKASGLLEVSGAGITVQAQTLVALDSVTGGSGADRFVFDDGASIGGILDGGGIPDYGVDFANTLDYAAYTTQVIVDISSAGLPGAVGTATGTLGVKSLMHVIGGSAGDSMVGGNWDAWFEGGNGNDTLVGGAGWDRLSGGSGDDSITGGQGEDALSGGSGKDLLRGGDSRDTLEGGSGNDTLYGDSGDDALNGGSDHDSLYGGIGNDTLVGDKGDDLLDGGAGVADEARFAGPRSDYAVSSAGSTLLISSAAEGNDKVTGVELFRFSDGAYTAAALLAAPGTVDVEATVYTWKTHTLLQGTTVSMDGGAPVTADVYGVAALGPTSAPSVDLEASRGATAADQASVTLADAVSILKMIAGLPVNPPGQALSPYQSIAADADGNGSVTLADALGVLRHAVGLPTAATPKWVFVDEADLDMPARAGTTPGTVPTAVSIPAAGHVGLVGILRGDVNGSWTPPAGAEDLDDAEPGYFNDLAASLNAASGTSDFNPSQWGVYGP